MNAIQFIKDHGVEVAREAIDEASAYGGDYLNGETLELSKYAPSVNAVFIPDLKRLVESVDLVGRVHGITTAKAHVKQAHEQGYLTISIPVEINGSIGMGCLYIDTLEKAIADYEQLFGNTETLGGEHV